jgi:hypothetical protein
LTNRSRLLKEFLQGAVLVVATVGSIAVVVAILQALGLL